MKTRKFRLILNKKIIGYEKHSKGAAKYAGIFHSKDGEEWVNIHICPSSYIEHDDKEQFINHYTTFGEEIYENDIVKCRALTSTDTVTINNIHNIPIQIHVWSKCYEHDYESKVIGRNTI